MPKLSIALIMILLIAATIGIVLFAYVITGAKLFSMIKPLTLIIFFSLGGGSAAFFAYLLKGKF